MESGHADSIVVDRQDEGHCMTAFPKMIYQTWATKTLPPKIQHSIDNMLKANSNYGYQLYDDEDMLSFISNNYDSSVVDCFNSLRIGAAKADLWRYLILYKHGGVYLDVDSIIFGKLDDLIGEDGCSVISRENNPGKFVQWCLMFTPGHPILKNCIDSCLDNIRKKNSLSVLELTGPVVYSHAVNQFFGDSNIYYKTDEQVNSMKATTGVRFHHYDYMGYAQFEHPNKSELYANKPHWTVEQRNQI